MVFACCFSYFLFLLLCLDIYLVLFLSLSRFDGSVDLVKYLVSRSVQPIVGMCVLFVFIICLASCGDTLWRNLKKSMGWPFFRWSKRCGESVWSGCIICVIRLIQFVLLQFNLSSFNLFIYAFKFYLSPLVLIP